MDDIVVQKWITLIQKCIVNLHFGRDRALFKHQVLRINPSKQNGYKSHEKRNLQPLSDKTTGINHNNITLLSIEYIKATPRDKG